MKGMKGDNNERDEGGIISDSESTAQLTQGLKSK